MIYLFAGPTLREEDVPPRPRVTFLPPAGQGDVYALIKEEPWAIGIIDGYFERTPAVSHKEILWAMAQGIHLYGAASMGALRAVELEAFGMVGVGSVFEDYRNGVIEDDDEVAVAHGPESEGYRAGSEAMVNIRATLERAFVERILTAGESRALCRAAKETFYPLRHYGHILEVAQEHGLGANSARRFRDWVRTGRVDRKREDASRLLALLTRRFRRRPPPKKVAFPFHRTQMWDFAMRHGAMDESA